MDVQAGKRRAPAIKKRIPHGLGKVRDGGELDAFAVADAADVAVRRGFLGPAVHGCDGAETDDSDLVHGGFFRVD